jgi:hypothetical protein
MAGTTIQTVSYNSSTPVRLDWDAFTTGTNEYIDLDGKDASKVLILIARQSTIGGTTYYVGTSASAATGSSYTRQYSQSKLNRMKIGTSKAVKAKNYTRFRCSGTTHLVTIEVLGPFESARFKDTDGYINIAKAITGSTTAKIAAILVP